VKEVFGFYLKPFNFEQMAKLSLTENELDALFEIGRDFEDIANMIFVTAINPAIKQMKLFMIDVYSND
jgi:hypothetical protein